MQVTCFVNSGPALLCDKPLVGRRVLRSGVDASCRNASLRGGPATHLPRFVAETASLRILTGTEPGRTIFDIPYVYS